jgi:hypothetical protein
MTYVLFGLFALTFSPVPTPAAEVMFEGYYRLELSGKHVGYSIQRYEFDPKAKNFISISFLRLKIGDEITQRSLKAKANDKFHPLSYQYTALDGKALKSIDATFKGEIMQLKIGDGKNLRTETHKIPKKTFMTSFLQYVMLQRPMPLNKAFTYSGIAEEEGASYWGKAWLATKEDQAGHVVFRVINNFKDEEFVSRLAAVPDEKVKDKYIKAEVIGTSSPKTSLTAELVAAPAQATEGQLVPNKVLIDLFGGMPAGKINMISK